MPNVKLPQSFELRNNKGSEKHSAIADENDLIDVLALYEEVFDRGQYSSLTNGCFFRSVVIR